jgi:hypothetical protein
MKMMFMEGNNKGRQDNPDCVKEGKFCTRMRHGISIAYLDCDRLEHPWEKKYHP